MVYFDGLLYIIAEMEWYFGRRL